MVIVTPIDIDELAPIIADMEKKIKALELGRTLNKLLPKLRKHNRQLFSAEESPTGERWAPLARSTIRRRKNATSSSKILVRTGRLKASLTSPNSPDNVANIVNSSSKATLFWGSRVPYSKFHQRGTKRLLARPHIATIQSKDLDIVVKDIVATIIPILKRRYRK